MAETCPFCEIVARRSPASVVGENDEALAFLTLGPLREGHALVIPKRHVVEFVDASPSELAAIARLGRDVAERQRRGLGATGETLFVASGPAGEQSVRHLHLHVVPRAADDGLDLTGWWEARVRAPGRAALDATAHRLRPPSTG